MTEKDKFKCTNCLEELEENKYTNLWFEKYKCKKCWENFIYKLVKKYKIFYLILICLIIFSWINSVINWNFPFTELIFSTIIWTILFKDFNLKKNGLKTINKANRKIKFIVIVIFCLFWISMFLFQWKAVEFNENQKKYIWNWKWDWIDLNIRDWYLDYKKQKWNTTSSVSWPIIKFTEEEFIVWIWFINSNFKIDKKPYKELNLWKMTIDWNNLSRVVSSYELSIPEKKELIKLTNWFTKLFNDSILSNNYELFFNWISKTWQWQASIEYFKKIFPQNNVKNLNLDNILLRDIIYSKPPYFDENNFLILEWYYLSKPNFHFVYKFICTKVLRCVEEFMENSIKFKRIISKLVVFPKVSHIFA